MRRRSYLYGYMYVYGMKFASFCKSFGIHRGLKTAKTCRGNSKTIRNQRNDFMYSLRLEETVN